MDRRRRGLGLVAKHDGASEVWRSEDGRLVLILGSAANAAAALESEAAELAGVQVSHIVCVGNTKTAQSLQQLLRTTSAARASGVRPGVELRTFPMADRLRSDDVVDIASDLAEPLAAVRAAVAAGATAVAAAQKQRHHGSADAQAEAAGCSSLAGGAAPGMPRGVLVHCDMGHNRSPTLVLAFLVSHGLSLREAYRHVLGQRPSIDPLPPYRRGLQAYELAIQGACSVGEEEPFAMHITQLMDMLGRSSGGNDGIDEVEEDVNSGVHFGEGLCLRVASIEALLAETAAAEAEEEEEHDSQPQPLVAPPPAPGLESEPLCPEAAIDEEVSPLKPWAAACPPGAEEGRCSKCDMWRSTTRRRRFLLTFTSPRTVLHRCKPSCHMKPELRRMAARGRAFGDALLHSASPPGCQKKPESRRLAARGCLFW